MSGRLRRLGLHGADDAERARECVARAEASGARSVRVAFVDPHGALRGKTLVAGALPGALADGVAVPSSLLLKDTSQRTVFDVWGEGEVPAGLRGAGDALLVPVVDSWRTLPWAPDTGWLLCDVARTDGEALGFASRTVLARALERLRGAGLDLVCGLEIEFHVHRLDDAEGLPHADATAPAAAPATSLTAPGWQLLGESTHDAMHETFALLRAVCDGLGLPLRTLESEMGPGQVELTFAPGDPMRVADDAALLRSAVRQACRRAGLHASFMCRPRVANAAASGWHLHQSVVDAGTAQNRVVPSVGHEPTPLAGAWIAGRLRHARGSCLMTTPTVNGYRRYGAAGRLAPDRVAWAHDNKGAMLRALLAAGDGASRVENRVADPSANPHFLIASQVLAGLDGVDGGFEVPAPEERPHACEAPRLPSDLGAAIEGFDEHGLYRRALGDGFVDWLVALKRAEWRRYLDEVSEWEEREYFSMF